MTNSAQIVSGVSIDSGAKHTYTVTARYRVNLPSTGTADSDPSDCQLTGSEQGTGLLNEAAAVSNGFTTTSSACRPIGDVEHDKILVSAEPVGEGKWRVVYNVVVRNLGSGATSYSLDDDLHFGDGISVVEASATGPSDAAASWNGQSNPVLATDTAILDKGNAEYADHRYVITVLATVPLEFPVASGGGGSDIVRYRRSQLSGCC